MKDAGRVSEGQNNTTSADCQQVLPIGLITVFAFDESKQSTLKE